MPTPHSPDSHLARRKDSPNYYFRCRIPADLLDHFAPRVEIWESLGTPDPGLARSRARHRREDLERAFMLLRGPEANPGLLTDEDISFQRAATSFLVRRTQANLAALLGVTARTVRRWRDQGVLERRLRDTLARHAPEGPRRALLDTAAAAMSGNCSKEEHLMAELAALADDLVVREPAAQARLLGLADALREVAACLARGDAGAADTRLAAAGIPEAFLPDWREALRNPGSTAGDNLAAQFFILRRVVSPLAVWGGAAAQRYVDAYFPCMAEGKLCTPAVLLRNALCKAAGNGTALSVNRTSHLLAESRDNETVRQTLIKMGKGTLPKEKQAIADLVEACVADRSNPTRFDVDLLVTHAFLMQDAMDRLAEAGWTPERIAKMKDWGTAWLGFLCPD